MEKGGLMAECDGRGLSCSVGHTWTVQKEVAGHRSNKADEILAGRSDSSVN